MKRNINILVLLCLPIIVKAQAKISITIDSTHNYFITNQAPNLVKLKLVDSLLNIESQKSYIKVHLHGDHDIKEDYQIYYLKDGWKYSSNYKGKLRRDNDINFNIQTENSLYQHIVYTDKKVSSGYDEYIYLIVINRKIVSSCISSDMLTDIHDERLLNPLTIYSMFY